MKYIAPTIINQHNALKAVLGLKGSNLAEDNIHPMDPRSTVGGYESDE